jgi:hypothetical protein
MVARLMYGTRKAFSVAAVMAYLIAGEFASRRRQTYRNRRSMGRSSQKVCKCQAASAFTLSAFFTILPSMNFFPS